MLPRPRRPLAYLAFSDVQDHPRLKIAIVLSSPAIGKSSICKALLAGGVEPRGAGPMYHVNWVGGAIKVTHSARHTVLPGGCH